VHHAELFYEQRRAKLREKDLYDKSDGSVQLGIRNRESTFHF